MKILIVGKGKSGQSKRLQEEAEKRGHVLASCLATSLAIVSDKDTFVPTLPGIDLTSINVIYLLSLPKLRWDWYVVCDYLNKKYATKIVEKKIIDPNYKVFFSSASEYIKQVENKIAFPKTVIMAGSKHLQDYLSHFRFPLVVKNSYGQRGEGIHLAGSFAELKNFIDADQKSASFKIREYIPNNGDIRVFTVGYKAIGAIKRMSQTGDFRSNISLGGVGAKFDLSANPKVQEIAEKISQLTRSEIAGVDIIIHKDTEEIYVLEVNRGPQFLGLEKYAGVNVAQEIIKYFETLV